jgi:hypothetical protein
MEMKIRDFIIATINKIRPESEMRIEAQYEDETPIINTEETTDSMIDLNYEPTFELKYDELNCDEQQCDELQYEELKCEEPEIIATDLEDEHEGCSKVEQKKCICQSCGNIYYYSDEEKSQIANIFIGKLYTSRKMNDFRQCPRCGSVATMYKNVRFWIDNKGNCVDVEEGAFNEPTLPNTFQNIRHDYGHCNP